MGRPVCIFTRLVPRHSGRSFAYSARVKTLLIILCAAVLASACRAPESGQAVHQPEGHEAVMALLADMVTKADDTGALIRFVDLSPSDVQQLRKRCGGRYQVFPIEMAEEYGDSPSNEGAPDRGLRLKGTQKDGVHIRTEVTRIRRSGADAVGSYQGRLCGSGWRFTLYRSEGVWRVTSSECTVAE
jgi:hypothetical protein